MSDFTELSDPSSVSVGSSSRSSGTHTPRSSWNFDKGRSDRSDGRPDTVRPFLEGSGSSPIGSPSKTVSSTISGNGGAAFRFRPSNTFSAAIVTWSNSFFCSFIDNTVVDGSEPSTRLVTTTPPPSASAFFSPFCCFLDSNNFSSDSFRTASISFTTTSSLTAFAFAAKVSLSTLVFKGNASGESPLLLCFFQEPLVATGST
mmetsp:Transcript_37710/g.61123  ORF Transcript_37710/g.61123 Transcript_37710/m.61123 type:complete len:202 (+) Transcript_37710:1359-1964(+)